VEREAGAGGDHAVARLSGRVDVQVGQVGVAQRDEVPLRGEVGLQVDDRLAVFADRERQLAVLAGAVSRVLVPRESQKRTLAALAHPEPGKHGQHAPMLLHSLV
jgi:predicted transcriptional regulator